MNLTKIRKAFDEASYKYQDYTEARRVLEIMAIAIEETEKDLLDDLALATIGLSSVCIVAICLSSFAIELIVR